MTKRNEDPAFDPEEIDEADPLGEQAFAEAGFQDADDGGPDFSAPGLVDSADDKRPGGFGQKVAGVPEDQQRVLNTPSEQRTDSENAVIRERGGEARAIPRSAARGRTERQLGMKKELAAADAAAGSFSRGTTSARPRYSMLARYFSAFMPGMKK